MGCPAVIPNKIIFFRKPFLNDINGYCKIRFQSWEYSNRERNFLFIQPHAGLVLHHISPMNQDRKL